MSFRKIKIFPLIIARSKKHFLHFKQISTEYSWIKEIKLWLKFYLLCGCDNIYSLFRINLKHVFGERKPYDIVTSQITSIGGTNVNVAA